MSRLEEILQLEMTRKQFILTIGSALMALIGIPALLGIFTKGTKTDQHNPPYGYQRYGP